MSVHEFYKFHHARCIVVILLNIFLPNILKVFTYQSNMILILYIQFIGLINEQTVVVDFSTIIILSHSNPVCIFFTVCISCVFTLISFRTCTNLCICMCSLIFVCHCVCHCVCLCSICFFF